MWRLYDWTCLTCGTEHEEAVCFPQGEQPPPLVNMGCRSCGVEIVHKRNGIQSSYAEYLADRPMSPMVKGGTFDTEGYKKTEPLPEFTGDSFGDFKDFTHTKDYQEVKKIRAARRRENKAKKKRAELIRKGATIDIRHYPLPGDPKI